MLFVMVPSFSSYFCVCVVCTNWRLFETHWPCFSSFFNALVYFRPRYLRWRIHNTSRSRCFSFSRAIFSVDDPRPCHDDDGDRAGGRARPEQPRPGRPSNRDHSSLEKQSAHHWFMFWASIHQEKKTSDASSSINGEVVEGDDDSDGASTSRIQLRLGSVA